MILYESPISGNCHKVRQMLALRGLQYESREVDVIDRSRRAELLGALNPSLTVPVLILDDGRPLGESNAILCYLARGTHYFPDEPFDEAKVLQWLFFEQYSHEPNIAVARFLVTYSDRPVPQEYVARLQKLGERALGAMDAHLADQDFLAAGRFTIADIALYAYTHVAHEGGFDLSRYPHVEAWIERVRSQDGESDMPSPAA
jgi:glutathione S-transferase